MKNIWLILVPLLLISCSTDNTPPPVPAEDYDIQVIENLIGDTGKFSYASWESEAAIDKLLLMGSTPSVMEVLERYERESDYSSLDAIVSPSDGVTDEVIESNETTCRRISVELLLFRFGDDRDQRFDNLFNNMHLYNPSFIHYLSTSSINPASDEKYLDDLLSIYSGSTDSVKSEMINTLVLFSDKQEVVEFIINEFRDAVAANSVDSGLSITLVRALGDIGTQNPYYCGDGDIVNDLIDVIENAGTGMRQTACVSLGQHSCDETVIPILRGIFTGYDSTLRRSALTGLAYACPSDEIVPELIGYLSSPPQDMDTSDIVMILEKIGPKAVDALESLREMIVDDPYSAENLHVWETISVIEQRDRIKPVGYLDQPL